MPVDTQAVDLQCGPVRRDRHAREPRKPLSPWHQAQAWVTLPVGTPLLHEAGHLPRLPGQASRRHQHRFRHRRIAAGDGRFVPGDADLIDQKA